MNHEEAGRYWNANAEAWTTLARAGYDIYRDFLNTPAFFEILPDVTRLHGIDIGCGEGYDTRPHPCSKTRRSACFTRWALVGSPRRNACFRVWLEKGLRYFAILLLSVDVFLSNRAFQCPKCDLAGLRLSD
jgi:hypothetical protein